MDRDGETQGNHKTCHFRRAAITDIFENNCSSSVKTLVIRTQETDALTGMLFWSLCVYLICATCHVVFSQLSLVKWAVMFFGVPEPGVLNSFL